MKLSERAMLVSLTIRSWDAKRTDRKGTAEVAATHNVAESKLRLSKDCIDTKAVSYVALKSAITAMRDDHYTLTLPWANDGARVLTTMMFDEYMAKMREHGRKVDKLIEAFAEEFPHLKAQAQRELNGLWNERDYPSNIRSKFGYKVTPTAIPEAGDFRCKLATDDVKEIREQIAEGNKSAVELAMREPYQRLADHIERMVERLSGKEKVTRQSGQVEVVDKKFRDTLVTGLADLCQILPGLNLTGDPQLEDLRKRCEGMIEGLSPDELRDNPKVRRSVRKQAEGIQDLMAQFMGTDAEEAA